MNDLLLNSIVALSATGIVAATILFIVAKKFYVYEDPKIDLVEAALPAANCGGCGFAGCRNFAEATVKEKNLGTLNCPVGGNEIMAKVAEILGQKIELKDKTIAVLRCDGSKQNAPKKVDYQAATSCTLAHNMFAGESGCAYGCLGAGDCCVVCQFDALQMDQETGLPVVDSEKCTSCEACVKACPRNLFEIRPYGVDGKRIYVACMNKEKGGPAKKNCKVACIGCSKCARVYESDTVTIADSLSYISPKVDIDTHGPFIVGCCPTKAIIGVGVEGKVAARPKPKPKPEAAPKTEEDKS